MIHCPECGHQTTTEATACDKCGHAMKNGDVQRRNVPLQKLPPPPEVAVWVIEKVPPEMIAEARRTFNEEELLAALREYEETGGVELKDFIHELEEGVHSQ